jgi:pimeloyl-ACP methyl ester carboxylesterase
VLEVGDGPPVVFFTGGPRAAATWSHCAAYARGLRCILVERAGTGLSAPVPNPPDVQGFPGYLTTLTRDVLDALGLDRVALVGSSLGGCLALRSAATLPDRVESVVLAGCPAFVPGWHQPKFFTLLRTPILGRLIIAAPPTRSSARMGLQLGYGRSLAAGRIPQAMLDWERAWQRDTPTLRNDAAMIVGLGSWRRGFDGRLDLDPSDLAAAKAPCLVLVGTEDPVGAEPVARRLVSLLPDATLEVLDGAGHLPWLDDPAGVADRIATFVLNRQ